MGYPASIQVGKIAIKRGIYCWNFFWGGAANSRLMTQVHAKTFLDSSVVQDATEVFYNCLPGLNRCIILIASIARVGMIGPFLPTDLRRMLASTSRTLT